MEDLAELPESAGHRGRVFIHGIRQMWSRVWLRCVLTPPSISRPQSLILSIYVLTGLVMLVTQPVIVLSPVLVESRKLRLAVW